jgi:hypothetical protein
MKFEYEKASSNVFNIHIHAVAAMFCFIFKEDKKLIRLVLAQAYKIISLCGKNILFLCRFPTRIH